MTHFVRSCHVEYVSAVFVDRDPKHLDRMQVGLPCNLILTGIVSAALNLRGNEKGAGQQRPLLFLGRSSRPRLRCKLSSAKYDPTIRQTGQSPPCCGPAGAPSTTPLAWPT